MIALVAIAISAVGWLSYRNVERTVLPRVLERIEAQSRLGANEIESHVQTGRGDIAAFQGLAAVTGLVRARLNGGIDPVDHTTEAVWRKRLEGQLAVQTGLKPAYSLRLIGVEDGYREIVRIDRSGPGGAVRIVPEAELKQVGDATYFRETISLSPGQAYVSPVHLNDEKGVIETAHVPILQIAMRSSRTAESRSVSSLSMQICGPCSTAFGLRRGRMRTCTWSMTKATTSFIPTATANSARNWDDRPNGKATSPTWLPRLARRKASRAP